MADEIVTTGAHHVRLIVTDPKRSLEFYTSLLNFKLAAELPPGYVMSNGNMLLGVTSAWEQNKAIPNDKFSANRVGLDHLSFGVSSKADLEKALQLFEERGVIHGEIKDLVNFGISILSFDDPDGIHLELTAPLT